MAYDYSGPWSTETSHQANLFDADDESTPFNTQTAVSYYISQGVAASKIVLGMPLYGRVFDKTKGLGLPYSGIGSGTWEQGVYDFKALPLTGAMEFIDSKAGASFSFDATKGELISYDNIAMAKQKAAWIQLMGLGGGMWWESSADVTGSKSLIRSLSGVLGGEDGSGLEITPNELSYVDTTYANLRAGMPGSVSSETASSSTSTISALSPASLPSSNLLTGSSSATVVPYRNISSSSSLTFISTATIYSIASSLPLQHSRCECCRFISD